MFFSRKKQDEANRIAKNEETRLRFADKLAAITEINKMITDTVIKTQAANLTLLEKLKRHLKNGTRSFVSLSDKLMVGVLVLDYRGEIIQSNPKAKEILQCKNDNCVGSHIFELISTVQPVSPPGEMLTLSTNFFTELSNCVFNSIKACNLEGKNDCTTGYMRCLSAMPCTIQADTEQMVQVTSPFMTGEQCMKFTFSILSNEPEEIEDIAYVILFRPNKKGGRSFLLPPSN